jgi:hypothetical protein
MTKYAKELNRRIQSGEPVHITRDWFLEIMCRGERGCRYWADLSPQEQMFAERMLDAYEAWLMTQAVSFH